MEGKAWGGCEAWGREVEDGAWGPALGGLGWSFSHSVFHVNDYPPCPCCLLRYTSVSQSLHPPPPPAHAHTHAHRRHADLLGPASDSGLRSLGLTAVINIAYSLVNKRIDNWCVARAWGRGGVGWGGVG